MPRKQRFKPSRKPAPPTTSSSPQADERKEIHPDDVDPEVRGAPRRTEPACEDADESDPSR